MPEVAITIFGRDLAIRSAIRPISLSTNPRSRRNSALRGGSCGQKFIGQAHRAQRQAHSVADMALAGNRQLTTAAAQVDHQRVGGANAETRNQAEVDQPRLFQSGDDFDFPPGGRAHPLQKSPRVARVAQGAGGHHANRVRAFVLYRPMEAPQRFDGIVDGLGGEESVAKDTVAQASDLAVFMNFDQPPPGEAGDFQADGVRSDIDRG